MTSDYYFHVLKGYSKKSNSPKKSQKAKKVGGKKRAKRRRKIINGKKFKLKNNDRIK